MEGCIDQTLRFVGPPPHIYGRLHRSDPEVCRTPGPIYGRLHRSDPEVCRTPPYMEGCIDQTLRFVAPPPAHMEGAIGPGWGGWYCAVRWRLVIESDETLRYGVPCLGHSWARVRVRVRYYIIYIVRGCKFKETLP